MIPKIQNNVLQDWEKLENLPEITATTWESSKFLNWAWEWVTIWGWWGWWVAYNWIKNLFTATSWQTVFTLSDSPWDNDSVEVTVNGGWPYIVWEDYTISLNTVTWLNNWFTIETWDKIEIKYIITY